MIAIIISALIILVQYLQKKKNPKTLKKLFNILTLLIYHWLIDWLVMLLKTLYAKGTFHRQAMEIHINLKLFGSWRSLDKTKRQKIYLQKKSIMKPSDYKWHANLGVRVLVHTWWMLQYTESRWDRYMKQCFSRSKPENRRQKKGSLSEVSAPPSHRL